MRFYGLGRALEQFEREEWGTNDMEEIQEKIQEKEWADARKRMTGMEEEQADWEYDMEVCDEHGCHVSVCGDDHASGKEF